MWFISVKANSQHAVNGSILLYASFDEHADRADYANGLDRFGGGGYKLVEGYRGKAVDLRNHGLEDDFWATGTGFLPHMTQWLLWPRGNFDFRQGTMEFWFKGATPAASRVMDFHSNQPLRPVVEGQVVTRHIQPYLTLTNRQLRWLFVSLKGELIEGSVTFSSIPGFSALSADHWHYFTMQWSPEGFGIYLDGRLLYTQEFDDDGLALVAQANRSIAMEGIVMDELAVWDHPRHGSSFEPEWKNQTRPAHAFPGVSGVKPIEHETHPRNRSLEVTAPVNPGIQQEVLNNWTVNLDNKSGYMTGLGYKKVIPGRSPGALGLLLWRGVEREPLSPSVSGSVAVNGGAISFTQEWGSGLSVKQVISPGAGESLAWDVSFTNNGNEELWLEALLSLPFLEKAESFFDMSWTHRDLRFNRRRDEYTHSLPLVSVSDGSESLGVGLDPRQSVSALIGEWIPPEGGGQGEIRQGSRVVLSPGETQELRFVVLYASGEFDVQDALAAYQDLFPGLYKQKPETSIYSYMGVSQHFNHVYVPELARQHYIGNQWGHLAYHTKGDFLGREEFWGREDLADDISYEHAMGMEKSYKTIENMRNQYLFRNQESFESFYTLMRTHDLPNSAAHFIVREVMPGVDFLDDPLVAGQYYMPKNMYVNELNTPLGEMFKEDLLGMMELVGEYSTGCTNDLSQWSPYRFTDEYARSSPGRAFSADRGVYLVAAAGAAERYRLLDSIPVNGKVKTMWSDYGGVSYTLSAYSSANAIESGEWFYSLGGLQLGLEVGRNLLGEKPMSLLTSYGLDDLGRRFTISDFTPATLRDYYRFGFRRIGLAAFRAGYYLDPPMLHGKLWNSEINPMLVESLVHGRKTVPAVKVNDPLWVVRGGEGGNDIVVVGNSSTVSRDTPVTIYNSYFDERDAYLWAPYFGGEIQQSVSIESVAISGFSVGAHDVSALKPVARLDPSRTREARVKWEGDGLTIKIELELDMASTGVVTIIPPTGYYAPVSRSVNGKETKSGSLNVSLEKGENRVEVVLRNMVLDFDMDSWNRVGLLTDGQPTFRLLSGSSGYEKGTANQFNLFLQQYDEEDGIEGNLEDVPHYTSQVPDDYNPLPGMEGEILYTSESLVPGDYTGWIIDTRHSAGEDKPRVVINEETKRIEIKGANPGEVRRATMLLLRLVDRTYPHIGRFMPLGINITRKRSDKDYENAWKGLMRRTETLEFFEDFEDKYFLSKPILHEEHEPLYENGNKDFEGKYEMRTSPYLFEPTFEESIAYDYFNEPGEPNGFLRAEGRWIVDEPGERVTLRTAGLGSWLFLEPSSLGISPGEVTDRSDSHQAITRSLSELAGQDNTVAFLESYTENYLTSEDVAFLKESGFNAIRLPLNHRILVEEGGEEPVFIEKGFALVDTLLEWCEEQELYLILSMHTTPGGQSDSSIKSNSYFPGLWDGDEHGAAVEYRDRLVALWGELARRFGHSPRVGGYELINGINHYPPDRDISREIRELYIELTSAIREQDTRHIIFVQGNGWGSDMEGLTPVWDDNMVYSFRHTGENIESRIEKFLSLRDSLDVPVWVGEGIRNSNVWYTGAVELLESHGIGWSSWAYKEMNGISGIINIPVPAQWEKLSRYLTSSSSSSLLSQEETASLLNEFASSLRFDSSLVNKDVIHALFDQINSSSSRPFGENRVPGTVFASGYDLGGQGHAYFKTGSLYKEEENESEYNAGGAGRNDPVDIWASELVSGGNGLVVGGMNQGEWLNYTVNVAAAGNHELVVVYSAPERDGSIDIKVNGIPALPGVNLPVTGEGNNYVGTSAGYLALEEGENTIQFYFNQGVYFSHFSLQAKDPPDTPSDEFGFIVTREGVIYMLPQQVSRVDFMVYDLLGRLRINTRGKGLVKGVYHADILGGLQDGLYIVLMIVRDSEKVIYSKTRKIIYKSW